MKTTKDTKDENEAESENWRFCGILEEWWKSKSLMLRRLK